MNTFGIRHLSPAGAFFVRKYLDKYKPKLILIEGPSDFNNLIPAITDKKIKPPFAVMAYTTVAPVQTILYPFSIYSPEYQALLWGKQKKVECRFCDLPSDIFLGLNDVERNVSGSDFNVYAELDKLSVDKDSEVFWERTIEHCDDLDSYVNGSYEFGKNIREFSLNKNTRVAEDIVRESYMRRVIKEALDTGIKLSEIVIITGAFHTEGIKLFEENENDFLSDEQLKALPKKESKKTLMPYSYFRLSERSGYGAGNKAPAYYELIWENRVENVKDAHVYKYLSTLAKFQREHGNIVSSAEVIEAVRLAFQLAKMRGSNIPAFSDLRDAAVTCMGHGSFSELVLAFASTDIGTKIGSIPPQSVQTSIQVDFYEKLAELKLEKYKSVTAEDLVLDLRENIRVKSKELAFLDLNCSFFLHKLSVLKIAFATVNSSNQESGSWQEKWVLRWTPEAEIQLVESILKGDTIEMAASFELGERIKNITQLSQIAEIFQDSFLCGLPKNLYLALQKIDEFSMENISIHDIAAISNSLNMALNYGDIRKLDLSGVSPLLYKLTLRATLNLEKEANCDTNAASILADDILTLNNIIMENDELEKEIWINKIKLIATRDDLNTKISGLCMAILLDLGEENADRLGVEVEKRLSKGMPAELGAGWFEGLSMKNHYSLILRQSLWIKLSDYMDTLDEDEFKHSLVCLRRAFTNYNASEKDQIAENLGEIWGVNPAQVSEILNTEIPKLDEETINQLDDFDFDF